MEIKFDYVYGSGIPICDKFSNKTPSIENAYCMFQRIMGVGMSQNRFGPYILEWLIMKYNFQFVCEIGTNKGGLALYLANMASVTRQFRFITIEAYPEICLDNSLVEGAGHWLRKIEKDNPYFSIIIGDAFSSSVISTISNEMNGCRSLLICDGGNKAREFEVYSEIAKNDDFVMVHDWGVEVNKEMIALAIAKNNMKDVEIPDLNTSLKLFRKK